MLWDLCNLKKKRKFSSIQHLSPSNYCPFLCSAFSNFLGKLSKFAFSTSHLTFISQPSLTWLLSLPIHWSDGHEANQWTHLYPHPTHLLSSILGVDSSPSAATLRASSTHTHHVPKCCGVHSHCGYMVSLTSAPLKRFCLSWWHTVLQFLSSSSLICWYFLLNLIS